MATVVKRSAWTHILCNQCWGLRNPNLASFIGPNEPKGSEVCCGCGKKCVGISLREDPDRMKCEGRHP